MHHRLWLQAVLKASGFRAAFSYVLEMKQLDDQLEMATKDVKRAAARGLGPPLKATEVKLGTLVEACRWSSSTFALAGTKA